MTKRSRPRFGPYSRREFLGALSAAPLAGLHQPGAPDAAGRVLAHVTEGEDLALLQQMIRIRSYSGGGEESRLARFMADQMKTLGCEVAMQEVQPGRFNAIGALRGSGGGASLMLNGHIDTNPVGVGWTVDPFEGLVRDGFVFGIGVSNMKASCAAFLGAVRALVRSRIARRGDLILAYVVGELQGGIGTLKMLDLGVRADTFIVGEPTDLAVVTLHAGSLTVQVTTLGVTRHMSKAEESVSAIDTMYLVIARIRTMTFTGPANPEYQSVQRVNIGSMRAGLGREYHDWRPAQVPDVATTTCSVRFGPGQSEESVLADLRRTLEDLHREDPRVVAEVEAITVTGVIPPRAFEVSKSEAIVRVVTEACTRALGSPPPVGAVAPYRYYGSDASHLQHVGGMKGVVCGAGGKYNTMPDERVELAQFHAATRAYALVAAAVCG